MLLHIVQNIKEYNMSILNDFQSKIINFSIHYILQTVLNECSHIKLAIVSRIGDWSRASRLYNGRLVERLYVVGRYAARDRVV